MASRPRAQRREYNAKQRRLRKYRARLQQEQTRAPRCLQGWEQALGDLGLPATLAAEVEWRLKAPAKRLSKIFGLLFPPVFGCRTTDELSRVRGGDKNLPSRRLGALPTQKWVRQLPHRGQDLLATRWHPVEAKSPATRRRWPWTGVGDDSVFKQSGPQRGRWSWDRARRPGPARDRGRSGCCRDGQLVFRWTVWCAARTRWGPALPAVSAALVRHVIDLDRPAAAGLRLPRPGGGRSLFWDRR